MEIINNLGIIGMLVVITLIISVYSSVLSVDQIIRGNSEISSSFNIISKIYLTTSGLGILISIFLIFTYLLVGKKSTNLWVKSSVISYAIIVTFLIFGTILFVLSAESGALSYAIFYYLQGSYILIPITLMIVFLVIAWMIYTITTHIKATGKE